MGTFVEAKVSSRDLGRKDLKKMLDGSFDLAAGLEKKLSAFDPASEVNELNVSGDMEVSTALFAVIKRAKDISRMTGGEFDPTVAPLLKKEGFYRDMPGELLSRIPEGDKGVGINNIEMDPGTTRIVLRNGAWLDLSGIAKGYIVDRMSSYLKHGGAEDILVNAGGDIYCGERENGRKWRIGIRKPGEEEVLSVLELSGRAVATSGDYENVVIENGTGRVMSHIVDPSGREVLAKLPSSFTVMAPDCATADALATGMMAMGAEKALKLADRTKGVEVIIVGTKGDPDKMMFSSGAKEQMAER